MTFSCKRKSYVFSLHYLCGMETMTKKFCKKYKLPENTLHELLSHMAEVRAKCLPVVYTSCRISLS